jgi:hypothetical protein
MRTPNMAMCCNMCGMCCMPVDVFTMVGECGVFMMHKKR